MPIGNLTAFLQYIIQILFAIMMATFMFVIVPRAAVSSDRIQAGAGHRAVHPRSGRPGHARRAAAPSSFATSSSVTRAPRSRSCAGISFTAGPGETTAIVGSTGSGKSTLVNLHAALLRRERRVGAGRRVDVREMDRADLWGRIGLIPQKAFLFSGTVASNLRYGDETADRRGPLAAPWRSPRARTSWRRWKGGLEAPITQGGTNVSGGQRQRLAIARALVKKPEIYVFDDSFSALDFRTDARLRAALERGPADATVLIVAQRVGTIMQADRIIVLDDGRIVGIGTHDELHARPARPTARSSTPSSPRRRSHERADPMAAAGRRRPARRRGAAAAPAVAGRWASPPCRSPSRRTSGARSGACWASSGRRRRSSSS